MFHLYTLLCVALIWTFNFGDFLLHVGLRADDKNLDQEHFFSVCMSAYTEVVVM